MAKKERAIKCVFLISTKIEHTFYSLAIPVLGTYQDKCTHLCNNRHARMPFETSLIIASYRTLHKCSSRFEEIDEFVVYPHNDILYSNENERTGVICNHLINRMLS